MRVSYIQRFEWTATFEKEFLCKIVIAKESCKMGRDEVLIFDVLLNKTTVR